MTLSPARTGASKTSHAIRAFITLMRPRQRAGRERIRQHRHQHNRGKPRPAAGPANSNTSTATGADARPPPAAPPAPPRTAPASSPRSCNDALNRVISTAGKYARKLPTTDWSSPSGRNVSPTFTITSPGKRIQRYHRPRHRQRLARERPRHDRAGLRAPAPAARPASSTPAPCCSTGNRRCSPAAARSNRTSASLRHLVGTPPPARIPRRPVRRQPRQHEHRPIRRNAGNPETQTILPSINNPSAATSGPAATTGRRHASTTTTHAAATTSSDRCDATQNVPTAPAHHRSSARNRSPKPSRKMHSTASGAVMSGINSGNKPRRRRTDGKQQANGKMPERPGHRERLGGQPQHAARTSAAPAPPPAATACAAMQRQQERVG